MNLAGPIDRCDQCGTLRITYHSCRNRHCPTCQHMPRERWLVKRKREILSTRYFHVVFTLPHALNHRAALLQPLIRHDHQKVTEIYEGHIEMDTRKQTDYLVGFWPR